MDKLTIISGILFLLADISAIISIAMPDWIITDIGGNCGDCNLFVFFLTSFTCRDLARHFLCAGEIKIKLALMQITKNCSSSEDTILILRPFLSSFLIGDTRLGLMWSCMTLYNRDQVCFKSQLKSEWMMALVCIFVGCILITATIILLVISHWDRTVIPFARWVGFGASTYMIPEYMIFNMIKYK